MTGNSSGIILQPRDQQLLSTVGHIRLVDREMAQVILNIPSIRNTNKRLLELTRSGLLSRYFIGTIAGGRKAIYTLSPKGAELAQADYRGIKRRSDETLVGDLFVQHQLEISFFFVALHFQPIPIPAVRLIRWLTFYEPPVKSSKLIPDAYFELHTPSGTRSMFLEVDRGTETLRIWERKVREYLQLAVSGDFTRTFGGQQFRALVVTTSERRLQNIRDVVSKSTDKVFWLSTFARTRAEGLWSAIWRRPTGNQDHSLV